MNRGAAVAVCLVLALGRGDAQVPVGADTLSAKAIAESIAVLSKLDDAVRANRNDAASWYRAGMIAWALSNRAQAKPPVKGLDWMKYNRMADTSLRIAAQVEPRNYRFLLGLGQFLRYAPDPTSRTAAIAFLDAAADAARHGSDPAARGTAVLEAGRIHWLRYDDVAHRRLYLKFPAAGGLLMPIPDDHCPHGLPASIDGAIGGGTDPLPELAQTPQQLIVDMEGAVKALHDMLAECTHGAPDAGDADYSKAEALFREALNAAPDDPRAFRHVAMLLAEKNRWRELAIVARDRTTRVPTDANGWLALGLALHRGGNSTQAQAVFDTGLTRLSTPERGRLFSFTRLLTSTASASLATSTSAVRERTEQGFWAMAAPLWSRPGNNPHTEFLARVTYAELRWTVEEMGVRGADSDRGEMYVRYGPPDSIAVLHGGDYTAAKFAESKGPGFDIGGSGSTAGMPGNSDVISFWDYANGLFVVFWGAPTYGTAHFPPADRAHISKLVESRPAAFDNVVSDRIEGITYRSARFRASADSVDVLFLTRAPVSEIRAGTAANVPVREHAWLFGREVPNAYLDSLTLEADGLKAWTYRVPPSSYMYRVEATAEGASVAGRATAWVTAANDTLTGFTTRGFGVSDLIAATTVAPRIPTPLRWRDFSFAPLLASLPKQSNLELIWENYEFGQRGGQAQYQITLTIQKQRSAAGRIAAQIVSAVAGSVGVTRRDDRVVLQFERSTPFASTLVDHVTVGLADTPAGSYRVLLEITDHVTGRKTSRATELMIQQ